MFLKRIDIQGFKSFAEKISFEFTSGITSVVGPNGSGKSNIADAIRWVLGEQSIKNLRGSKMEDVIFAGTENRKPLGFAEVSLTIDNSDKSNRLPIDFDEVTIKRRVFRSGESEYFINKTPCRLKDITELFLDTGIGKDGYSVIGQGKIDEILSSKPGDRRLIFEEASGIMKYKVRKNESEKKLELTQQNMIRIGDIILELEAQLEPLKEQSEKAREFLGIREELKVLDVNVYLDNLLRYKNKLSELDEQDTTLKTSLSADESNLESIIVSSKSKSLKLKILDDNLEKTKQDFYNLRTSIEKSDSEININDEKINNLEDNISRIDVENSEFSNRMESLNKDAQTKQSRLLYLENQLKDFSEKLAIYENRMSEMMENLNENEQHIENMKTTIMDKMDLLSDKKMQTHNVKVHIESIEKRKEEIGLEIHKAIIEKDKDKFKKEDLASDIRETSGALKKQEETLSKTKSQLDQFEHSLGDERTKENQVKSDLQYKTSRVKTLREMDQNLEGYNRSVKHVLQLARTSNDLGEGVHGALAQLIKAEKKYETAIEMTLGSSLQNIITSTEEDAKSAIEFLKKNKQGRATFLPISAIKGRHLDKSTLAAVSNQPGFCGIAANLVEYDSVYEGIISNLLGRVVVVEDLDKAIAIARRFKFNFKIVTLDGDILNSGGQMTGGSIVNRGTGILGRGREISELDSEIEVGRKKAKEIETQINKTIDTIDQIKADLVSLESDIKNTELILVRDESHMSQIDDSILRHEGRIEMLKQEKIQLDKQQNETNTELEKYSEELSNLEDEIENAKEIVSDFQNKYKKDQDIRDALHIDITDHKISVNSIRESIKSEKEATDRISDEKGAIIKNIGKRDSEKERYSNEIKSLLKINEGIKVNVKNYETEKTGKVLQMDKLTEERKVLEDEIIEVSEKTDNINKNITLLKEDINRLEVKKIKLDTEKEAIQNRMWDEYELTYTSALELKSDIGSIHQAQKKINELRLRIKELGPVNVAAIDEYVKTKERFEFMSKQKNDMEQAAEKLKRVIYEMTSVMKKQFLNQFNLINANFQQVFSELFNGGRARLLLSDPDNVLDSGIDIEVQPPGKKLQNMMLLSGGERAFTAIALLFSILKLKPAPFCVLDEIEAALDDANVFRFANYLRKYSKVTQFIMITHRKGTMENSDMLYGVTMQEYGVSKIVSMKMGEKVG